MVITAPMMAIGGVILALSQDAAAGVGADRGHADDGGGLLRDHAGGGAAVPGDAGQDRSPQPGARRGPERRPRDPRVRSRRAPEPRGSTRPISTSPNTAIAVNRLIALLMPAMILMMNLTSIADHLVRRRAHRRRRDAGRRDDRVAAVRHADPVRRVHGHGDVRDAAARGGVGRAHQRGARRRSRRSPIRPRRGTAAAGRQARHVEFQNVTFQYPGAEEPALTGVSFTALPGEVTAIIGGTGSGKSTLAGLIPRFYDVNEGRVLVDGVDVREMTQADLRARIGFVPQKAVLFSGTIASNIRYGREDATDDEVRHAAAVAQAVEFIDADAGRLRVAGLAGRHQPVGRPEAAAGDCAGDRPARRTIYVFDDSFSALDFATDARLRAALKAETRRRHGLHRLAAHRHGDERRPHRRARRRAGGRHRHARRAAEDAARSTARSWSRRCRSRRSHERRTQTRDAASRRPRPACSAADRWAASACRCRRPRTSRARCVG